MKRTNGTDHTITSKDTLDQKLTNIYGKSSLKKKSDERFNCIHTLEEFGEDDGYDYDDSTHNDDDEIYD